MLAQGKDKTPHMVAEQNCTVALSLCVHSMALHQDVLHAITASVVSALQQAGITAHSAPHSDTLARKKAAIDTKAVRIRDFDGTPSSWEGWAHSFKSATRSTRPEALAMMEEAEKTTDATDEVLELDKFKDVDKISAEMHNILSQYCIGEALTMVKSVMTFEGFLAWQKIFKKYNPKTMARTISLMKEVASPKAVKEIRDIDDAITTWENKVKRLDAEYRKNIGNVEGCGGDQHDATRHARHHLHQCGRLEQALCDGGQSQVVGFQQDGYDVWACSDGYWRGVLFELDAGSAFCRGGVGRGRGPEKLFANPLTEVISATKDVGIGADGLHVAQNVVQDSHEPQVCTNRSKRARLERCMTTCGKAAGFKAKRRSRARKEASAKEVRGYYKQFAEATRFFISLT